MLRRDVDEAVVAAAAHTPFEASHRIFVLERADVMNDEAANALLKTLEEPPSYVVLVLLTDRLTQVLPTIASRCQAVRFDPPGPGQLAQQASVQGVPPQSAEAAARLSLGDAHKAIALALGDGPALRAAAENLARSPIKGTTGRTPVESRARPGQAARADGEGSRSSRRSRKSCSTCPRRSTSGARRSSPSGRGRADRRATTQALDHALQLTGLWYRDLVCVAAGAPELAFHSDGREALNEDAGRDPAALRKAQELVDDTRSRLILNVSEELACEALAYRLEETLSSSSSSA